MIQTLSNNIITHLYRLSYECKEQGVDVLASLVMHSWKINAQCHASRTDIITLS